MKTAILVILLFCFGCDRDCYQRRILNPPPKADPNKWHYYHKGILFYNMEENLSPYILE